MICVVTSILLGFTSVTVFLMYRFINDESYEIYDNSSAKREQMVTLSYAYSFLVTFLLMAIAYIVLIVQINNKNRILGNRED